MALFSQSTISPDSVVYAENILDNCIKNKISITANNIRKLKNNNSNKIVITGINKLIIVIKSP